MILVRIGSYLLTLLIVFALGWAVGRWYHVKRDKPAEGRGKDGGA
jgi:hypothetical protein